MKGRCFFLKKGDYMERAVRTSAKALIIRDGRMLAVRLRDGVEVFHIMPGGGQHAGEPLPDAAAREVAEELGVRVRVGDLAFVIEGTEGEAFHRVDMVFRCEYLGEIEGAALQGDTNQVGFDWLDVATLNHSTLYPSKLRRAIMNLCEGKPQAAYLGVENVGDPEENG